MYDVRSAFRRLCYVTWTCCLATIRPRRHSACRPTNYARLSFSTPTSPPYQWYVLPVYVCMAVCLPSCLAWSHVSLSIYTLPLRFSASFCQPLSGPYLSCRYQIVFCFFLPQVLDKNFSLGNIILPVSLSLLQLCPSPQRYASDYQAPTYSLWVLEPHIRRSWLNALLVILYKVRGRGPQKWFESRAGITKFSNVSHV